MKRRIGVATLVFCIVPQILSAQGQSPSQADVRVRVKNNDRRLVSFEAGLEGGTASLRGSVQNLSGKETVLVSLRFDYRTDADIALDELISQIVISTVDPAGNEFSRVMIDPNTVPLNPNRASLYYSATVYRPAPANRGSYVVRVQVFGNYE